MKGSPTKYNILSASKCGIEFEMYSEKNSSQVAKELGRVLNKKIVVPKVMMGLDKEEKGKYHSEIEPTSTLFKLEKDYSGGKNMLELITGPLVYEEARLVIIKTLAWIRENGWTDNKCSIHLNISFNSYLLKTKREISHLDPLKFILNFDENYVYERFPERKNSVYARSINQIIPINKFAFIANQEGVDPTNYRVPDEKYYGVNFTKRAKNYLEIRYIGGEGYEFKTQKILEILDYTILKIYDCLNTPEYTLQDYEKLKKISISQKAIIDSFSSPERFFIGYPKINVFIDLRGQAQVLKSFWTTIREDLFKAVIDGGMTEGIYNYDTDAAISQLRYAKLKNSHEIRNFEIFDSELEGSFEGVILFRCKIRNSRINKSKLIELNEAYDCKVENTASFPTNAFFNCYINCPQEIVEGKIDGGVVRNAILGVKAEVSSRTLIVEVTDSSAKNITTSK
jgi:hypothetical protein